MVSTFAPNQYVEVFNILKSGYTNYLIALLTMGFPTVFAFINIIYLSFKKLPISRFFKSGFLPFPFFVLCLSASVPVILFSTSYWEYHSLSKAFEKGQCDYVEGTISNFQAGSYEGKKDETFKVRDHLFKIDFVGYSSSFHQIGSESNPIKKGKMVRIYSVKDKIVKLEIKN